jgi:hypothetical protein
MAAGHARAEQARVNMEATRASAEVDAAEQIAAAACAPSPQHPDARVAPNGVLRSALFAALPNGSRDMLRSSVVRSLDGVHLSSPFVGKSGGKADRPGG